VGAAVCPHPPLLLPGVGGAGDPVPLLRDACRRAVAQLLAAGPQRVVVVGGAAATGVWDPAAGLGIGRFTAGRVGAAAGSGEALPLALAVGQVLLDDAGWAGPRVLQAVAADAPTQDCLELGRRLLQGGGDESGDSDVGDGDVGDGDVGDGGAARVGLLVLGDGSARRTLKAPGYLDARAEPFDAAARAGLSGDLNALRRLDPALAAELLVAGRAAWHVLAGAAAANGGDAVGAPSAAISFADDPFGVAYVVGSWTFPDAAQPA